MSSARIVIRLFDEFLKMYAPVLLAALMYEVCGQRHKVYLSVAASPSLHLILWHTLIDCQPTLAGTAFETV